MSFSRAAPAPLTRGNGVLFKRSILISGVIVSLAMLLACSGEQEPKSQKVKAPVPGADQNLSLANRRVLEMQQKIDFEADELRDRIRRKEAYIKQKTIELEQAIKEGNESKQSLLELGIDDAMREIKTLKKILGDN